MSRGSGTETPPSPRNREAFPTLLGEPIEDPYDNYCDPCREVSQRVKRPVLAALLLAGWSFIGAGIAVGIEKKRETSAILLAVGTLCIIAFMIIMPKGRPISSIRQFLFQPRPVDQVAQDGYQTMQPPTPGVTGAQNPGP